MKVIEKRKNGSIRVYTVNNEPSMTDQQFKDDCDVNFNVNKFTKTGHLTHLAKFQGMYADVSAIPDLAEAMQMSIFRKGRIGYKQRLITKTSKE